MALVFQTGCAGEPDAPPAPPEPKTAKVSEASHTGLACPPSPNTCILYPLADTTVYQNHTSDFGSAREGCIGNNGNGAARRMLMRFNMASIPSTAVITDANLQIRVWRKIAQGASFNIGAHRLTTSWSESGAAASSVTIDGHANNGTDCAGCPSPCSVCPLATVCPRWCSACATTCGITHRGPCGWTGNGVAGAPYAQGHIAGASAAVTIGTSPPGNYVFDSPTLTADARGMHEGTLSNFGWMLKSNIEDTTNILLIAVSTDETGQLNTVRPQLVVTYKKKNGVNCAAPSECFSNICVDGVCCGTACAGGTSDCFECQAVTGNCVARSPDIACGSPSDTDCDNPDTCNASGTCLANNVGAGVTCLSDGNSCTNDQCNGAGTCTHPAIPDGTACPDDGNLCTSDACAGGSCGHPPRAAGFACGSSSNTDCDNPDTCNGGGTCLANNEGAGVACTTDNNVCTNDQCNGTGTCVHPNVPDGTACTSDLVDCTSDICSAGNCAHPNKPAGSACGSASNTDCDNPDTCNASGGCLVNNELAGTACTADPNVCTSDVCNASGTCTHPALPAGTPCTSDGNPCTVDQCNAVATCVNTPGNAGTSCRVASCAAGVATLPEVCNGSSATCPGPNTVACTGVCNAAGTQCEGCISDAQCGAGRYCLSGSCFDKKANGQPCTGTGNQCTSNFCVDSTCCATDCAGGTTDCQACNNPTGTCTPRAAGAVCRTAAGECDLDDQCNGAATTCADNKKVNGTACTDDGADCTNDTCNGVANACQHPPKAAGAACASDSNPCTLDQCNGSGTCAHPAGNAGAVCRAQNGQPCDQQDLCDGVSIGCADGKLAAGAACPDEGNACTNDTCNGVADACQHPAKANGTACPDDANPCTTDTCQAGACAHPAGNAGAVCRGSAGACDVAENCNGSSASCPADLFLSGSTQCRAASCTANVATISANCPGTGPNCPAPQTNSCPPFICAGTACGTSCASDAGCAATGFCNGSTCENKRPNGGGCAGGNQCTSGLCVDGFCCNSACTGQCQACDVPGSLGSCTPVNGTPRGGRPVCAGDGTACDGFCNGVVTASCTLPGASTQCRAPSCTGGTATLAASCAGIGACPAVQTQDCGLYACGPTACRGNCTVQAHCAATSFCSGGVCTDKRPDGQTCNSDPQCESGHCIDGVCCDRLCPGQCEACNVTGSVGTCSPVMGLPQTPRPACVGDGSVCSGFCDGTVRTSCTYPGSGTSCRTASCTAAVSTLAADCDGRGTCPPEEKRDCAPFTCGATGCAGDCTIDGDCSPNEYCQAGICTTKRASGVACATSNVCISGVCADGVCCNAACTGQCEACNLAGSPGICTPVSGAPRGTRPQCTTDGSPCAGTCDGTRRDGCTYPGPTLNCRGAACSNQVATVAAFCQGDGRCPVLQEQDCAPANCVGNLCNVSCTTNANCPSEFWCSGGACIPKLFAGTPCGSNAQCVDGFCVDGLCCNRACTGQCEACDVTGSEGTCTNVGTGLPHGGRPSCGGVGPCTARCTALSGTTCTAPGATQPCGTSSCANGVQTEAPACNGAGTCLPPGTTACGNYVCDANACKTSCATVADCVAGMECVNSQCVPPVPDSGPDTGAGGSAGSAGEDAGAGTSGGGSSGSAGRPDAGAAGGSGTRGGSNVDGGAGTAGKPTKPKVVDEGGCGCRVPERSPARGLELVALAGLLALARRRRSARA